LGNLSDGKLINSCYFLLTHFPNYDLDELNDFSLKLHGVNESIKGVEIGEYIFGLKTNFVLKWLGF